MIAFSSDTLSLKTPLCCCIASIRLQARLQAYCVQVANIVFTCTATLGASMQKAAAGQLVSVAGTKTVRSRIPSARGFDSGD